MNKVIVKKFGVLRLSTIAIILASIFLIFKEIRAFSGSTQVGGIWNYIQISFICIGFFTLLSRSGHKVLKSKPVVYMLIFAIYATMISIVSIQSMTINELFSVAMTPYSAMVLVLFCLVGYQKDIDTKNALFYVFFIIAGILSYNMLRFYNGSLPWAQRGAVADVYYVLGLLPLILVYNKSKLAVIPIGVTTVAVLFSGKRAGIIALVLMIVMYYLIEALLSHSFAMYLKKIFAVMIIVSALIFIALYLDNKYNMRLVERLMKLSEDGGSGRDIRWEAVWEAFVNSNLLKILFGHGKGSIVAAVGGHAHNDFLEVIYEYGIAGLTMYAGFYLSLIKKFFQMYHFKYRYTSQFAISLICSLMISLFSFYVIDPTYVTCGMICFGLFLSDFEKQKIMLRNGERNGT